MTGRVRGSEVWSGQTQSELHIGSWDLLRSAHTEVQVGPAGGKLQQ